MYPVGRSHNAGRLLLALWALGICTVTLACAQAGRAPDWKLGIPLLGAIAAGMAVRAGARRWSEPADLAFDGEIWTISGAHPVREAGAHVPLDLQSLIPVCLDAPERTRRWVWLDRTAMPDRWRDLRRALYSRAPGAGPAGQTRASTAAQAHHSSP